MRVRAEYRDREETEVAVLDALADRGEEGMTVLELRGRVDAGIDDIEAALGSLKREGLIDASAADGRTVIRVDERVLADGDEDDEWTARERLELLLGKARRVLRRLLFP